MEKTPGKKIQKVSSCQIIEGMYHLRRTLSITSCMGLVPSSQHFLETDDPSQGWYILIEEALRVGLMFPTLRVVACFLYTYNLSLTKINPNRWRNLLSLVIINRVLGYELSKDELHAMYSIKRDEMDESRVNISNITL